MSHSPDEFAERLSRYLPVYPRPDSSSLIWDLAHMQEFRELTYQPGVAETPEKGELLATQKFAQRLFNGNTAFNRALFWREPGTGKTCSAGAVIEEYAKYSPPGSPGFRKALVIVKNSALVEIFRREIAQVCAPGSYGYVGDEDYFKGVSMSEAAINDRLRRSIAKVYDIKTFNDIVKLVKSTSPEVISKMYSHVPVIVDEAHAIHRNSELAAPGEGDEPGEKVDVKGMYSALHTFLHCLKGGYQILMTGTPMWDSASEFADIMNLILPLDKALPTGKAFMRAFFDENLNLTPKGRDLLRERCRGMISFLRASESTIGKQEMGVALVSQAIAFPCVMSKFQADYVKTIREEGTEAKGGDTIFHSSLDASDAVLPLMDSEGKVVGATHIATGHIDFKAHKITSKYLAAELKKNLAKYSVKFAAVVDLVTKNPKRCHFIHVRRVKGVGGAIFLGMILSLNGLTRVVKPAEITQPSPTRRYCVMTTDSTTTSTAQDIAGVCANASLPANNKGDLLQVVIGSDKVILGITLKNFTTVIQVRSHWGPSAIEQTMFRALRQGSHDAVPKGTTFKIYRLTSVFPAKAREEVLDLDDENVFPPGAKVPANPSGGVNLRLLEIVEEKDKPMTQIRHEVAKPVAFDCVANYHRNVLETDQEGTRQSDYQNPNYQCDGVPVDQEGRVWTYPIKPEEVDYASYNLFFAGPRITEIRDYILNSLRKSYVLHISEIASGLSLGPEERDLLYEAITGLVNARATVTNSLGIPCYVKESGNHVFLDSSITQVSNFCESAYVTQTYVTCRSSLGQMVEEFISSHSRVTEKFKLFCQTNDRTTRIGVLESLSSTTLAGVYEALWGQVFTSVRAREAVETLEEYVKAHTFHLPAENITFHTILTRKDKTTAYGAGSRKVDAGGKLRLYDVDEKRWVTPSTAEQKRLELRGQKEKTAGVDELLLESPYGFVGSVLASDKKFRIHTPGAEGGRKHTGKVATSWDIPKLQDLVVRITEPNVPISATEQRPPEVLRDVLGRMGVAVPDSATYEYLKGLMHVHSINTKGPLIAIIKDRLEAKGLVYHE